MREYEKWYQFCMPCKYVNKRKDDAEIIYCSAPEGYCPYKNEIEETERKEE